MTKKNIKNKSPKLSKKKIAQALKNLKSKEHEASILEEALEKEKLKETAEDVDDDNFQENIDSERLQEFLSSRGRAFSPQGRLENVFNQAPNIELEIAAMRRFNAEDEKEEKERRDPLRYHVTGSEKYHTSGNKLYEEGTKRQYEEPGAESEREKFKVKREGNDEGMRGV